MFWLLLNFVISATLIVIGANRLSKYGEGISKLTGLSSIWIGILLLGFITSLPELIVCIASVSLVDAPDLGVGDIFGSNIFNLMIIAIIDIVQGKGPILHEAKERHILSAGISILLAGIVGFSITFNTIQDILRLPDIFKVGVDTLLVLSIYLIGTRLIFRFEKRESKLKKVVYRRTDEDKDLRTLGIKFVIISLIVVSSGIWLSFICDKISTATNLGHSFVGTIFLAITTSLPELSIAISVVKSGMIDMALGSIFGSNMFNIAVITISDLFYRKGPILSNLSTTHTLTIALQVILTCIVIISLMYRSKRSFLKLGLGVVSMIVFYSIGAWLLFKIH
ncbi:MAG: sodium:calcium antiporter [bacterium]|nr:sodium:calcium antiporter [bacterium]